MIIVAACFITPSLPAKELNLTPLIKNYGSEIFNIETQIWDIDQDKNGIIYAATNAGLYDFDGEQWKFHQGGTGTNLRAILCLDDIIYSSGSGGYGYWKYDDNLSFLYHRLYTQPSEQGVATEEFWEIEMTDEDIFFQSKINLHIYNRNSGEITIISAKNGFENLHKTEDGRIFIQDMDKGICYYQDKALHLIPETSPFASSISSIFSIGKKLYFVSSQAGIFTYSQQEVKAVNWEINEVLKDEKVFCVETDTKYGLLIGTIRHGLYLLDFNGKIIKHYNKKKGLQGNTILSVFVDRSHDIWLGVDGGISFVQESSPLQVIIDEDEDIGSVYSTLMKDDIIYLASNQGLFTLTRDNLSFQLDIIEGSVGQTWKIKELDNRIFVGHHNGAYVIEEDHLKEISNITGTWNFVTSPKSEDIIIGGSYHGLSLYQKNEGSWQFVSKIKGFEESSRYIAFDRFGYLWVAHPVKGYYRISLDNENRNCEEVKFYPTRSESLVEPLYFSSIDDDLIFYNRHGLYQYNLMEEVFEEHSYLNHINKGKLPINSLTQVGNYFWYVLYNSLKCYERKGKEFIVHNQPLYMLDNHLLGDFTSITPLEDNSIIVGMRDGIALIDPRNMASESTSPKLILRQIEKTGIEGNENMTLNEDNGISLESKYGNVRFYFASPSDLKYSYELQYKISKYQEKWSDWKNSSYIDLIGLSSGTYSLSVRAKDLNNNFSVPLSYNITIAKPYFLRTWLVTLYLLSILSIIIIIVLFIRKRAVNKELKTKREESIRLELKLEQVEKKALQIEKEKMKLEENQLKNELERTNNELISTSMNNVNKNDLLHDLRESVISINKISQNSQVISYSSKIASKIDKMLNNQDDWITFELHFKSVHQGFFDRLIQSHSNLSPSDLKLCAYLRLNLSTKEIASLINITPRSVEVARYRLRQKLELSTNENLIKHIMDI